MRDQGGSRDIAPADDDLERAVLALLLESTNPGPWSVKELAREVGGELETADAVARLRAVGLVHRCQEFVWATRPAARLFQLVAA
jgi:predicted transcriptional regulator